MPPLARWIRGCRSIWERVAQTGRNPPPHWAARIPLGRRPCETPRERALLLTLADSGIRREEASCLVWGDLNVDTGGLLVRRGKGGKARLSGNAIASTLERISSRAGIPFSAHALRRTFALLSLRAGCDIVSLQRLMGHADVSMTAHYLQQADSDLISAHEKSGLDSWL